MNLIIDIGTSFVKIAVFSKSNIIFRKITRNISHGSFKKIQKKFPGLKYSILSNVRKRNPEIIRFLKNNSDLFLELNSLTPTPLKNLYHSPLTLGYDRIAAAVGANTIFPDSNVLVVDIGSAITIDFINDKNEYTGGNISPGMAMRFKALNKFTANLPLEQPKEDYRLLGSDTSGAIISGVQNGIIFELEGYIKQIAGTVHDLKIIFTGGDADFFAGKLKNSIFVDLNLTLKGLNKILEYNIEKA